jgi:hypothetical protein
MDDGVLDEALAALAGFATEYGAGFSNHGPMAAEALVRLGRGDDVARFVDTYRRRLEPAPGPGRAPGADDLEGALGMHDRWADWLALFERELDGRPEVSVVAEWVPRLAPGTVGAATHGLIRTAHALRSLVTPQGAAAPGGSEAGSLRRHEMAEGLAYWAATYQELPGPPLLVGRDGVTAAVARLPTLPEEAPEEPFITERVRYLDMVAAPFEQAVASLGAPRDLHAALTALAVQGAVAYVANAGGGHEIALVHAVTAPMALDLLLPVLHPGDRPVAFAYGWQAVAALHTAYATVRIDPGEHQPEEAPPDAAQLAAAAVDSGDEHAIKLAEAALRVHLATGDLTPLEAAADAAVRLR